MKASSIREEAYGRASAPAVTTVTTLRIVSERIGSRYRSGRSADWLKFKNPGAPAVRREAEEDWDR